MGSVFSIFKPAWEEELRAKLDISSNAKVLLFSANGIRNNPYKDYIALRRVLSLVADSLGEQDLLFLALGEDAPSEYSDRVEIRFIPFQIDPMAVARYYQAADVYIHAVKADTFPNTVLEATACGKPVVVTAIGSIPEQIDDQVAGFLVPPGDDYKMAVSIQRLLSDDTLCQRMGHTVTKSAFQRFDIKRQADDYLNWYGDIVSHWKSQRAGE